MLPSALDSFFELLRKSSLIDAPAVANYLEQLKRTDGGIPSEPKKLAACMVRDMLLTQFQADQLTGGKWKGFFVGKYRVLEKIGTGGMGQVYLAEHKIMKHKVALKVLPRSRSTDPSALERFQREAKAGAVLDHPNLVKSLDIDHDANGDLHYLVMEYVDGINLQELVKHRGQLDYQYVAHIIHQAARGIQHAHQRGLLHRDIKPSNLIIDRDGVVRVLDMGLARFYNDDQDDITKRYEESVLGTADYLSPEQAVDSHSVDLRTDIYSLGATFYYALTGKPPFEEGTVAQKLIWHQTRRPKSVPEFRTDVPSSVLAILNRMMAKKAEDRYQTCEEVLEALREYGEMTFPPPSEDELPKLSPLARRGMTPDESSNGAAGRSEIREETPSPASLAETPRTPPMVRSPREVVRTASEPAKAPVALGKPEGGVRPPTLGAVQPAPVAKNDFGYNPFAHHATPPPLEPLPPTVKTRAVPASEVRVATDSSGSLTSGSSIRHRETSHRLWVLVLFLLLMILILAVLITYLLATRT